MDMLKQQAMNNMFREMAQRFADMTPEEMQRLKEMLADLNQMLDQQVWGEEPDFEGFMDKYGDMFGPNPPQSLEELVQQMASQMSQMQSLFIDLDGAGARLNLRDVTRFQPQLLRCARTEERSIVPRELCHGVRAFLHPAVVVVRAIVHRMR
jgi:uncharacterized protein with von Willebrand factor type A (vWA) domain